MIRLTNIMIKKLSIDADGFKKDYFERYSILNSEQSHSINKFLKLMVDYGEYGDADAAQRAIDTYWCKFSE